MVKVRLARAGSKKRPYYHIVVTDKQNARDGRFIEAIGRYDPSQPITDARVQYERPDHWCGVGAQISDQLRRFRERRFKRREVGDLRSDMKIDTNDIDAFQVPRTRIKRARFAP